MDDSTGRSEEVDEAVRSAVAGGDAARGARDALGAYGPELFGFLLAVLDDRDAARAAYASAASRVASGLATFDWSCSLRGWLYAVMREKLRGTARPPSTGPDVSRASDGPDPTSTISRRPAANGTLVAALRKQLSLEDRALLVLRVDREMSFREIAITGIGPGASAVEIARESARLRARMVALRRELKVACDPPGEDR